MTQHHSPNGEVLFDGDHATLLFNRQLAHAPDAVWSALTDPAQLRTWYMAAAKIDGRVGGTVDMVTGPAGFHWTGRILEWDPPRVFEYEWNADAHAHLPQGEQTVVRWELAPMEGGTLLTLTHRRLTKGTALGFAPGTHTLLDRLAAHLAKTTMPDWMTRYAEVRGGYPAWQRPG